MIIQNKIGNSTFTQITGEGSNDGTFVTSSIGSSRITQKISGTYDTNKYGAGIRLAQQSENTKKISPTSNSKVNSTTTTGGAKLIEIGLILVSVIVILMIILK